MATSINQDEPSPGICGESTGVDLINSLDNDCLRKIFLHLALADKLNAEKVCKRWRPVAKISWNDVKCLDLSESATTTTDYDKLPDIYKNIHSIAKILMRCGRYLDDLKLGSPCHYSMIFFVRMHCPNLVRLEISLFSDGGQNIYRLPILKRLKYLRIDRMHGSHEDVLSTLPCDTLSELHLQGDNSFIDMDFDDRACLPYNIDIILRDMKNVRVMSLNGFEVSRKVENVINQNTNLTFLSLTNCMIYEWFFFKDLTNLEHLDLENANLMKDNFIEQLSSTCTKLRHLNLNGIGHITSEKIQKLSALSGLEELSLTYLVDVDCEVFSGLRNLKKLVCENAQHVKTDGVVVLMRRARNLEYLNLRRTGVDHEVLIEANQVCKQRNNGVSLRVLVDNSVADTWIRGDVSPLLIVESQDDSIDEPQEEDSNEVNDHAYNVNYQFEYDYGSESEEEDDFRALMKLIRYGPPLFRECDTSDSDDI